jgi:hypothetical protein
MAHRPFEYDDSALIIGLPTQAFTWCIVAIGPLPKRQGLAGFVQCVIGHVFNLSGP